MEDGGCRGDDDEKEEEDDEWEVKDIDRAPSAIPRAIPGAIPTFARAAWPALAPSLHPGPAPGGAAQERPAADRMSIPMNGSGRGADDVGGARWSLAPPLLARAAAAFPPPFRGAALPGPSGKLSLRPRPRATAS